MTRHKPAQVEDDIWAVAQAMCCSGDCACDGKRISSCVADQWVEQATDVISALEKRGWRKVEPPARPVTTK